MLVTSVIMRIIGREAETAVLLKTSSVKFYVVAGGFAEASIQLLDFNKNSLAIKQPHQKQPQENVENRIQQRGVYRRGKW